MAQSKEDLQIDAINYCEIESERLQAELDQELEEINKSINLDNIQTENLSDKLKVTKESLQNEAKAKYISNYMELQEQIKIVLNEIEKSNNLDNINIEDLFKKAKEKLEKDKDQNNLENNEVTLDNNKDKENKQVKKVDPIYIDDLKNDNVSVKGGNIIGAIKEFGKAFVNMVKAVYNTIKGAFSSNNPNINNQPISQPYETPEENTKEDTEDKVEFKFNLGNSKDDDDKGKVAISYNDLNDDNVVAKGGNIVSAAKDLGKDFVRLIKAIYDKVTDTFSNNKPNIPNQPINENIEEKQPENEIPTSKPNNENIEEIKEDNTRIKGNNKIINIDQLGAKFTNFVTNSYKNVDFYTGHYDGELAMDAGKTR